VTGTTVSVHVGQNIKHGLQLPLVCTGSAEPLFVGETVWERAARALQHVHPIGSTREAMYSLFLYARGKRWMLGWT
jgi:hypothetical protein